MAMAPEEVISMCPMAHHVRQEVCHSRAPYRRGRRETAVKVFTVSDESKYLLIQKVPDIKLNINKELTRLCERFGVVERLVRVDYADCEPLTRVYLVKYLNFVNAVRAKKALDDYNFLGSILHVCYAPEMETIDETREKLNLRREYVHKVLNKMYVIKLSLAVISIFGLILAFNSFIFIFSDIRPNLSNKLMTEKMRKKKTKLRLVVEVNALKSNRESNVNHHQNNHPV